MSQILRNVENTKFNGCDFVLQLGEERKNSKIKLLQITDMQFIDATQRRTPDRLSEAEINAWKIEDFDIQCGNQIRSLIAQSKPDMIFITGDCVYGSFDDNGTVFEWFCEFMDSFCIPWAPVFGNHDNESRKGVKWQCEQLENSKYCIFKRGSVSGNSNYSIGIAAGDEILRVMYMTDSNGCSASEDMQVIKKAGIYADQIEFIKKNARSLEKAQGKAVPAFMAFHFPVDIFELAERHKGYKTDNRNTYILGVDVAPLDGDFGFKLGNNKCIKTEEGFLEFLKECNVQAVFAGHCHNISTCILYEGIKWVQGLKTGQYDYHVAGQLGGTLVILEGESFDIFHIPSLTPYNSSLTCF